MHEQKKQNKVYPKATLIRDVAERCFLSDNPVEKMGVARAMRLTKAMYAALEERVDELLSCSSQDSDVTVKLFEGISIKSIYVPSVIHRSNIDGKAYLQKARIRLRSSFTREFKRKLTKRKNED